MLNRELRPALGFLLLIIAVAVFRNDHGSFHGLVLSSLFVIAFWSLNGLNFAISSLRNMIVMSAIFGLIVLAAQLLLPSAEDNSKMGQLEGSDLNPAQIARLKESHAVAMELYYDHRPSNEERYFKVGQLPWTRDGFHYVKEKSDLDPAFFPRAEAWARTLPPDLSSLVRTLESSMRKDFSYTLTPGALHTKRPLDEFLFDSKKGFCEHYAASVATLLKLRGHRAQVVVGYEGGTWNGLLHRLTYLESDAHAWVEAADPSSHQWIVIDPTNWVMPLNQQSAWTEWNPFLLSILFIAILIILTLLFFYKGQVEAHEAFVRKIERLERRSQLNAIGLTLSERVRRLAPFHPERSSGMQASLRIYFEVYFANEPTQRSKGLLTRSLKTW